jgi:hypothetical protein
MMKRWLPVLLLAGAALVSCQEGPQAPAPGDVPPPPGATAAAPEAGTPNAQIEAAIRSYLANRPGLNLDNMTLEFGTVKIEGEQAEADVVFRSKNGAGEMSMHYTLDREGEAWKVRQPERHGTGEGQMPPGHPPVNPPSPGSSN